MAYNFDKKCYELAEEFLWEDSNGNPIKVSESVKAKLAQRIQDCIEDFLGDLEADRLAEMESAKDGAIDSKMDEQR